MTSGQCTDTRSRCGKSESENIDDETVVNADRFITDSEKVEEKGRLQFFFHSPESELPIRDVTNRQGRGRKTEPFLEKQAENYCSDCYQSNNIVPFLESKERYLFLQTTCRNRSMTESGERFVVGYLEKETALDMGGHFAVQGPISLYSFEDAYPGSALDCDTDKPRMYTLDAEETERLLDHFEGRTNIYQDCLEATLELEEKIDRNLGVPEPDQDPLFDEGDCGC